MQTYNSHSDNAHCPATRCMGSWKLSFHHLAADDAVAIDVGFSAATLVPGFKYCD